MITLEEVKAHVLLVRPVAFELDLLFSLVVFVVRCLTGPLSLQLGSFHRLRVEISSLPSDPELEVVKPPLDEEAKWAIFVRRAVWRFEKFWEGLERAVGGKGGDGERWDEERVLPPLGEHLIPFPPIFYHLADQSYSPQTF